MTPVMRTLDPRGLRNVKLRDFTIGLVIGFGLVFLFTNRNLVRIPVYWNPQSPLTGRATLFQKNSALYRPTNTDVGTLSKVEKVRILVWVMTTPANLETKATAVKETWGTHCNVLIFFSSVSDASFPTVGLDVADGRSHLTAKTMAAFRYLYENHFDDADWFMKADDDTFVVPENLRKFLHNKNTSDPVYFGHLFRPNVEQGYYSGGGGYVVSKEALRRFGKKAINSDVCFEDGNDEDVDWGICMEKLGVKTSSSTDKDGRTLFHPLGPEDHFLGKGIMKKWVWRYSAIQTWGYGVSPEAITFHYVTADQMRMLYFFLYHWKVDGEERRDGNERNSDKEASLSIHPAI